MSRLNGLYRIIERREEEGSHIFRIELNSDHEVYRGHFPGHPVTPGVILMKIVHELAQEIVGKNLKLIKVGPTKFLKVVDPEKLEVVNLELKTSEDAPNILLYASGFLNTKLFINFQATFIMINTH